MTNERLLIELVHRLCKYSDAMVLYAVLEQHADIEDFKTTTTKISLDFLGAIIEKKQVQRALERLQERGLLEVRTHANYRTHIKVDREAVDALLRQPVSPYLPGLREVSFPYLEHVTEGASVEPHTS